MEWLSALPPLVAVVIVLWKKDVILALVIAIFSAECLLASKHHYWTLLYAFVGFLSCSESPG